MNLVTLQKRIKGSKLYTTGTGEERLYFRYGRSSKNCSVTTYFQIINDRITPIVYIENIKSDNLRDNYQEDRIKEEIHDKFHNVINECELERKKIALHQRLRDEVIPIYEDSLLHQIQALRFCCSMKVTAMFADTGTGKSKISIDLAVSRYEAGQIKKVLVFCPVSTKKNFQDEIHKWCASELLQWKIIGLESMSSSDKSVFEALDYVDHETMIIIDESHKIKTPFAKRSKRIKLCCNQTSYKLLLTGTPGESVRDLFMQYGMLSDLIIGEKNWIDFENKYLITDERGDILGYKNVDHLMGLIEPYTYQVNKEDVLDIPAKTFKRVYCDLTIDQIIAYQEYKNELLDKLEKFEDCGAPATLIFQYFTYLQQISCGFIKSKNGEIINLGSHKTKSLKEIIEKNTQVIIFAKYLYEIDKIVECLGRDNCAIYTGKNPKERDEEKAKFTAGEKMYFVATMGTGGTGINGLQHCDTLIFYSNSFKWLERKQCIGRIDRQGQINKMNIYDIIPDCQMEYRIINNLNRKGNLADEIKEKLRDNIELKKYVQEI